MSANIIDRVIRGSPHRKTRFHDEKGQLVDLGGLLYAPAALATAAIKVLSGWRPERPMISFRATRALAALIKPDWHAVEFGSGLSTLWLARRCATLLSVEDNPRWHARVDALLKQNGLAHVRYELRSEMDFAKLDAFPDGHFHFALIDGTDRAGCVASVWPKMRAGGIIYLDNSDKDMTRPEGDLRRAEAALRMRADAAGASVQRFTDFSPGNFFAEEGLLVRLP